MAKISTNLNNVPQHAGMTYKTKPFDLDRTIAMRKFELSNKIIVVIPGLRSRT